MDRYNANRAPLFIALVTRLVMCSFFKTVERKGGVGNGVKDDDFRRVEADKQKAGLWSIINDLERCCCKYYTILITTFFIIIITDVI